MRLQTMISRRRLYRSNLIKLDVPCFSMRVKRMRPLKCFSIMLCHVCKTVHWIIAGSYVFQSDKSKPETMSPETWFQMLVCWYWWFVAPTLLCQKTSNTAVFSSSRPAVQRLWRWGVHKGYKVQLLQCMVAKLPLPWWQEKAFKATW